MNLLRVKVSLKRFPAPKLPRRRALLFLIPSVLLVIGLMILSGLWVANAFFGPRVAMWETTIRTLDPESDPSDPKWMTIKRKEVSPTGKRGNTLRYNIPTGVLVRGIDLSGIAVKAGANPQAEIVTIKGGTNAYLRVCNLEFTNYNGTEFEITNSEIALMKFEGKVEVEGESISVLKTDVTRFACGNSLEWGQLPKDSLSGTVSEIVIEVTGAGTGDAKAEFIKLNDHRVPGRTVANKLKPQKLLFRDVTFGDGDNDFSLQDFVVNSNNKIRESEGSSIVRGDAKIDNR